MRAVFQRELKGFFQRLSSYIFLAIFFALLGLFMTVYNFYYGYAGFEYVLSNLCVGLAVLLPLVTVPAFSAERRTGVDRFVRMLPLSAKDLLLGKFLSMLTVLVGISGLMLLCPVILNFYANIYYPSAWGGIFAFFLLSLAMLCIETFVASVVHHRVAVWIVSFAIPLALVGVNYLGQLFPESVGGVFDLLSLFGAYTPFMFGIWDGRSLLLWLSIAVLFFVLSFHVATRRKNP